MFDDIIQTMYHKKFSGIKKCPCNEFNHIACIFKGDTTSNIFSFGYNQYRPYKNKSIHAEENAINNLPYYERRMKKLCDLNILVIRITKSNELRMSKPCSSCVFYLKKIPPKKGYNVKHVYYSDDTGNISKISLNKL